MVKGLLLPSRCQSSQTEARSHISTHMTSRRYIYAVGLLMATVTATIICRPASDFGGVDWHFTFYPVTQHVLHYGLPNLYTETLGFYNPPWSIAGLLPFAGLGYEWGLAALRGVSIVILAITIYYFSGEGWGRPWALGTGIFNLLTFDEWFRGQLDVLFLVLPISLGVMTLEHHKTNWYLVGFALVLFSAKPPNGLQVAALFFLYAVRAKQWPKTLALPILALVLSWSVYPAWIWDWVQGYQDRAPFDDWKTTLWRMAESIKLPALVPLLIALLITIGLIVLWRERYLSLRDETMLVLCWGMVFSPYVTTYHYVALLATTAPYLLAWKPWLVVFIWGLTFTPLLRAVIGQEYLWLELFFAIGILVLVIWKIVETTPRRDQVAHLKAGDQPATP